jgi:dTDP-4-dehydrorhamnose reductase
MKILILGASGYVGSKLKEKLDKEHQIYGTYHKQNLKYVNDESMLQYELGNDIRLNELLTSVNPGIIISSLTGDFSLLIKAHKMIADYLHQDRNKKIFFISTANVFDGALEKAHVETDEPKADSTYGTYKIECECLLQNILGSNCIIIRIPAVWGYNSRRINSLVNSINKNMSIKTYKNIYVNVTTDNQIAEWISYIIKNNLDGIFHIGTTDVCEYNRFEELLGQRLGLNTPIYEIEHFEKKSYQAVLPNRNEIPGVFHDDNQ